MIDGVKIEKMKKIPDERGKIMHIMKSTDDVYKCFGEVYCSTVLPGIVKAWHIHDKMTLNYVVLKGMIKFVLYDERENSKTKGELMELFIGEDNYKRVTVPKGVWNGFKGIGTKESYVINVTDIPHDKNEIHRLDPHKNHIPYDWGRKDK